LIDWWLIGKMVLAICSYPVWETALIGIIFCKNTNMVETNNGKQEKVPFFVRLSFTTVSFAGIVGAVAMCYPLYNAIAN